MLQQRALYCDTDSVLYVQPRDESAPVEIGDNLGAMTLEPKPSQIIEEFVSGGPKNYAYKNFDSATNERKTVCKVRGITLNNNASRLVNFGDTRDMILGKGEPTVNEHIEKKIKLKRKGGGTVAIVTEPEGKLYRISFFKSR